MLVKVRLSTVKVSKHRFTQRRSLVKFVQACLGTVKVVSYRGRLLMLVKACLSTVKVCKRVFTTVDVSDDLAGLFKHREGL